MHLETWPLGPIETNAFFLYNQAGKALIIDTPHDAWRKTAATLEKKNLTLEAILITHGHWDHIADLHLFQKNSKAPIYAHPGDAGWITQPDLMNSMTLPPELHFPGAKVTHWVTQGQKLTLLGQTCEVRHVPGHAPGNVVYYFEAQKWAFVGDALFAGGVGRWDLPGGDFPTLEKSIKQQIYTLPEDTLVYSGHGPSTTVGRERLYNPYVKA